MRVLLVGFLACGTLATAITRAAEPEAVSHPSVQAEAKPSFWIIPHTHWEGAVFKTREEYLEMGLPYLVKAMHLLRTQPDYRFVLDQVAYVRPFLERYPEQLSDFKRFVKEGRLELVLGMDIMPDVNMPGGETFIRQMQYGKGYYRDKLGVDVTVAWLVDTFGHHSQMPQLLRQAGYTSFWHSRGVPKLDHPSEYFWEGLDGTRIAAFYFPHSYGLMYGAPRELPAFRDFVQGRFKMLDPNARGPERVGPAGVDVCDAEDQIAPMVAAYNRQENAPLTLRLAVPSEFEAVVAKRTDRPVYKGELNPIFQGTYSSRIELKRWMRDMEQRLLTAEKLAAITSTLGAPVDRANLWRAWEPVLFNETHDLASGVMTDRVYDDTIRSYEFSSRLADEQIHTGLNHLRFQIDTLGEGMPIVVWNPLAWPRTDTVELQIGFEPQAAGTIPVKGYKVFDPSGNETPAQTIGSQIYAHNGGIRAARIAFLARDVPALGYAVYRVHASETAGPPPGSSVDANSLENEHLKLSIDRATGAITSLVVKNGGWEALAGPGNVVSREPDKGDLWELYRGLDGGSKVAMKNRQPVPREGTASLTTTKPGKPGAIRVGPLFSEFQVENPFDSGTFATRVRLVHASRRVEIETRLVNNEKYVRYQVRFPTPFKPGRTFHEIPFGSVEQPEGIEFPAQNWVDHSDGTRGLAVLNLGIPGCVVTEGTILLSLLRSHNLGAYGFGGGYEPGMSSESGFQIGKERTMRYALLPHVGDARSARIFRDGMEYNHPLLARKAESHAGPLPPTGSFLGVSNPNVVLTSLTPGPEGQVIARLYEAAGTEAQGVSLTTARPIRSAAECNLLDQERKPLELSQGGLKFDLRPFEIKTFALRFDPPAPAE